MGPIENNRGSGPYRIGRLSELSDEERIRAREEAAHFERLRIADWLEEQPVPKAVRMVLCRFAQAIRGNRIPPRAEGVRP